MKTTWNEVEEIARATAIGTGQNEMVLVELARLSYVYAINDAVAASNEVKISAEVAAQKSATGSTEVGKAVARRIIQDKLESLKRKAEAQ